MLHYTALQYTPTHFMLHFTTLPSLHYTHLHYSTLRYTLHKLHLQLQLQRRVQMQLHNTTRYNTALITGR